MLILVKFHKNLCIFKLVFDTVLIQKLKSAFNALKFNTIHSEVSAC